MKRSNLSQASGMADHTTPLILNEWYVAALSGEVQRSLMSRRMLNIRVVLFRTGDGEVIALRDRCPHRSLPLSKGVLDGDEIICSYHGLRFGADGRCLSIPAQGSVPEAVRTERFAIREQDGLVWIWMGDAAKASAAPIPDTRWMSDPAIVVEASHSHVRASYVRLHENVLDLTHIPYLHGGDLASLEYAAAPFEVLKDGPRVGLRRVLRAQPLAQTLSASSATIGSLADRTTESWFQTPAIHQSVVTIKHLGEGPGGAGTSRSYFAHIFTPETQTSTHYFNIYGTDVVQQDAALRAVILDKRLIVIGEDRDALEEIEQMHEDETGFQEISVLSDRAGLLMRKQILSRAVAETAAAD